MLMRFRVWVSLVAVASLGVLTACSSSSSPGGGGGTGDLLVASQGDMTVSSFQVDLSTGKLSAQGAGVTTGPASVPTAMVITPDGNTAFVANSSFDTSVQPPTPLAGFIAGFSLSSDGTVSASGMTVLPPVNLVNQEPVSLAVDGGGKFLFVADPVTDTISVFTISGTTLTPAGAIQTGPTPVALAVPPANNLLYAANNINGTVSAYTFDSTTGALAPVAGSPYVTGGITPSGLATAATANGTFLYAANSGSNNVSAFAICAAVTTTCPVADGSLISVGTPVSAQLGPVALAVTPGGEFLYVVDKGSNQVSSYTISAATGALTATTPATISTGLTPVAVGIPSTGQYVYVANFGAASISSYRITKNSAGVLTGTLQLVDKPTIAAGQPSAVALK
ncbi:MAG: lactonase family protein [Acidobacteriia bacterium]|nr:lactonase family protein [Terriglobia bacterium]